MSEVTMKVAAFNMKNLGMKKVSNKTTLQYLTKIMSQYSIVVLLEVVDKSNKAMKLLLEELNNSGASTYEMAASQQLGRGTYKEQYVYFYRADEATLVDSYQYEDDDAGDEDAFEREPFCVRFSCPTTAVADLVLIPVHTKPEDAEYELDELADVVERVKEELGTDNIMILGDFNADGRYLSKKKRNQIRIHSPPFYWLIDDDVDTTSSNCNDETYDRIVVYGKKMLDSVVPGSPKAFNFQEAFKLSDEEAGRISDHYPVEVKLKTKRKTVAVRKRSATSSSAAKRRRR